LTGQYVVAVFLALSQFVEPYSDQDVARILQERAAKGEEVQSWELKAYRFKPLSPSQLEALSADNDALADYLRAACVRAFSSTQTQRSIKRGQLLSLDLNLFSASLSDEKINQYQNRLIDTEQGLSISEAKKYGFMVCNPDSDLIKYSEQLKMLNLKDGVKYYLDFYKKLPQISSPKDLPILSEVSFVKDASGKTIGEFSKTEVDESQQVVQKNRRRLSKGKTPLMLKKALVSIEDTRFWNFEPEGSDKYEGHRGVDFKGLMRALVSSGNGDLQGGSTITMQLAKNLILYKDVFKEHSQGKRSLLRKLKEYILVRRLEQTLSKDQILDLYLNTIDFGRKSQGVVMAAQVYFGKQLSELNLADMAFLAALPKAPNSLDPESNFEDALDRRNKVINSLKKEKYISAQEKKEARSETIAFVPKSKESTEQGYASFYVSAVEKQLQNWLSISGRDKNLASDVVTPINHQYQKWAVESMQRGLLRIERAKGTFVVKPSEDQLPNIESAVKKLAEEKKITDLNGVYLDVLSKINNPYPDGGQFKIAVVLSSTRFGLKDGTVVRRSSKDKNRKKLVKGKKRSLQKWDVVLLQPFESKGKTTYRVASNTEIQGGMVVIDNKTGAVLATSGGFTIGAGRRYAGAVGNRAFNAERQPGSTVKPFSYFSAMMNGLSPNTVVSNADIELPMRKIGGDKICDPWPLTSRKKEASSYTLRQGLEKSKNRLTVNAFAHTLGLRSYDSFEDNKDVLGSGIDDVLNQMKKFGLYKDVQHACYPILLGANELKVVDLAAAYSAIANGGVYRAPYVLKQVAQNGTTHNPFEKNQLAAQMLQGGISSDSKEKFNLFRVRTFLQGAVRRGTAQSMKKWSKVIAGKTGTTNGNKDAWFAGFNKEITVVVWVGYPEKKSLGSKFDGAAAALPIFKDFMEEYYKAYPEKLQNEFSKKPSQAVVAVIEPNTGFYITDEFQDDYKHYTGRTSNLKGVEEYFMDQAELSSSVGHYYPGSRVAGQFFFSKLSSDYKNYYTTEYNTKKQRIEDLLWEDRIDFENFNAYCKENKKDFPDHPDVVNTCRRAAELKVYIREQERSVGTLENYYLQSLGYD